MTFDLDGYVDVPERIRRFKEKYPDGYLSGSGEFVRNSAGEIIGYLYVAQAYTGPAVSIGLDGLDARNEAPCGTGTAYEPIPGKTPYTRDSEVMNAETSAWGRAIQALGFDFGAVASREEVRNRQTGSTPAASSNGGAGEFRFPSGKHQGKTLAEVPLDYAMWVMENHPREDVKAAARAFLGDPVKVTSDDDIPF